MTTSCCYGNLNVNCKPQRNIIIKRQTFPMRRNKVAPEPILHTCQNKDRNPLTWEGCERPNCYRAARFQNPLARPYSCPGARSKDQVNTKQMTTRVFDDYHYTFSQLPRERIVKTNLFPAPRVDVPHLTGLVREDYRTAKLPQRFYNPNAVSGYGITLQPSHPFYRPTSRDYGWFPPTLYTLPPYYCTTSNRFTRRLASAGMYKNYSLNTEMDKSRV